MNPHATVTLILLSGIILMVCCIIGGWLCDLRSRRAIRQSRLLMAGRSALRK